jgi:hypothetical protein
MSPIQDIFRTYGPEYLALYGDQMPQNHKKVMEAICECRSGSYGTILYDCEDCHSIHPVPCCCGNRHCPNCQQDKADEWLRKQMKKLLPTHYFLLTITLPEQLRDVVRSNQKAAYTALFSCAHESLKKLAKDKRFLGSSRIGYLAVLHTWGGNLQFHPHIHLVIPGGALSEKDEQWLPSRQDLFVHTKPLAVVFRAKFRDAMKKAHLMDQIPASIWEQDWVIDSQAVGQGQNCLRYLSRYVFRVAISNNRIKSFDNHVVRFLYKDRIKKKWKTMSLDAMEFIRRFLQHVLPTGFMKLRHYGFLNPNSRLSIEKISELISLIHDVIRDLLPECPSLGKKRFRCSFCGHDLKFLAFIKPIPVWWTSG